MKYVLLLIIYAMSGVVMASTFDEEWKKRYDNIMSSVCEHIEGECLVRFSAYKTDKKGLPINNLDKIAISGRVVVIEEYNPDWDTGVAYKSKIYNNPTWLDLCIIANEIIKTTGDHHHIYLETYDVLKEKNGIKTVELFLGS